MINILFVCRENRFRSVLAAQYFQKLMDERGVKDVCVSSAGTWARNGLEPIPETKKIAEKRSIDLSQIQSQVVNIGLLEQSSLILVMTESQKEALCVEFQKIKSRVFLLSRVCEGLDYDLPDPVEDPEETVENIGEEILQLIFEGSEKIYERAKNNFLNSKSVDKLL